MWARFSILGGVGLAVVFGVLLFGSAAPKAWSHEQVTDTFHPSLVELSSLPECEGRFRMFSPEAPLVDCRISLEGGLNAKVAFEQHEANEPGGLERCSVSVTMIAADGWKPVGEPLNSVCNSPSVRDLDGDGLSEVLLPISDYAQIINWVIFSTTDGYLTYAGEVYGYSPANMADGVFGLIDSRGCNVCGFEFFEFEGGLVRSIARVRLDRYDGELSCRPENISDETAERRFCALAVGRVE